MNRILLLAGGLLTFALALFKIAMPSLFHWQEMMSKAQPEMWPVLSAENLAISLLLLFFAAMSVFQWRELVSTGLGKMILLSIVVLWIFRAAAEIALFKIGVDGAWWRVFLFVGLAVLYLVPLVTAASTRLEIGETRLHTP